MREPPIKSDLIYIPRSPDDVEGEESTSLEVKPQPISATKDLELPNPWLSEPAVEAESESTQLSERRQVRPKHDYHEHES